MFCMCVCLFVAGSVEELDGNLMFENGMSSDEEAEDGSGSESESDAAESGSGSEAETDSEAESGSEEEQEESGDEESDSESESESEQEAAAAAAAAARKGKAVKGGASAVTSHADIDADHATAAPTGAAAKHAVRCHDSCVFVIPV